MILDFSFLQEALEGGVVILNGERAPLREVEPLPVREVTCVLDSRQVKPGGLFVALRGARVDGHDFLLDALQKGAVALLMEASDAYRLKKIDSSLLAHVPIFLVPDTLEAMVALARVWRSRFTFPVVGVTGSIGKTSTKEMIYSILQAAGMPGCVSYKNQNTLLGLCLNILKMRDEHQAAVFEVGISEKGEMEEKAALLRPTIGVITKIAHSHVEGLGPLPEIAKEKRKIFSQFESDKGGLSRCTAFHVGVVCGDQPLLDTAYYSHPVVRFGLQMKNQVQARRVRFDGSKATFVLKVYKEKRDVALQTNHEGMVNNALAAASVGSLLQIPLDSIVKGLTSFAGCEGRFEKRSLKKRSGQVISDCYNANPESMRAALLAVHKMSAQGKKVAVLGDMFGLGEKELFWHRQIGRFLGRVLSFDHVILIGERAREIKKTAPLVMNVVHVPNWEEAVRLLENILDSEDKAKASLVLVKASLAMGLERLVAQI